MVLPGAYCLNGGTMQPGEVLDHRYQLVEPLGAGGFGTVWAAFDTRMQRRVAVKVANSARSSHDAERFLSEALTVGSLNHPHVVTVHDYGLAADAGRQLLYIVMELIDGEPLDTVLGRGLPPLPQALTWMIQVSDALAAAHGRGVIHRDVKPANVLIDIGGHARVVDFGIAKNQSLPSTPTPAGITVGSFAYVAPERFEGIADDPRSDLYALGCVLTELCTGQPPFDGVSAANLMHQHTTLAPPFPSSRRPGLPAAVDRLVLELLAKNPGDRPQEAGEVRDLLREIARGPDTTGSNAAAQASAPTPMPPPGSDAEADAQSHDTNAAPAALLSLPDSLQAPARLLSPSASPPTPAAEITTVPSHRQPSTPRILGAIALAIVIATAGWLTWRPSPDDTQPSHPGQAKPPSPTADDHRHPPASASGSPSAKSPAPSKSRQRTTPPAKAAEPPPSPSKTPTSSVAKPSASRQERTLVSAGQADGYAACPEAKACLFEGWEGAGWMGYAPACGTIDLGSLRFMVSSVRTHGNPVTLYDDNHKQVGHVDGWAQTNLAPDQSDRAATVYIHCP